MNDYKTRVLKEYDEQFPIKVGAQTFSGKRAKAFITRALDGYGEAVLKELAKARRNYVQSNEAQAALMDVEFALISSPSKHE